MPGTAITRRRGTASPRWRYGAPGPTAEAAGEVTSTGGAVDTGMELALTTGTGKTEYALSMAFARRMAVWQYPQPVCNLRRHLVMQVKYIDLASRTPNLIREAQCGCLREMLAGTQAVEAPPSTASEESCEFVLSLAWTSLAHLVAIPAARDTSTLPIAETDPHPASTAVARAPDLDAHADSGFRTMTRPVLDSIDEVEALRQDWDGEGGLPASPVAAALARSLVVEIAESCLGRKIPWMPPGVVPTGSGGIDLTWRQDGRRAWLIVGDRGRNDIVCVTKQPGAPAERQTESAGDAVERVLRVLSGKPT